MILASKEEILAKDIKFNGQDVWTPVRGSANKWMQVGNRYHRHGKIHNPPPIGVLPILLILLRKNFIVLKGKLKKIFLNLN